MALFDRVFSRYASPVLQRHFADSGVATLTTVSGTKYENLDAILGHETYDEEYEDGDRGRRRLQTIKLRRCDGGGLPDPEINSTVTVTIGDVSTVWAVDRVEAWSETYLVVQCVRPERVERGVPGYRMSR